MSCFESSKFLRDPKKMDQELLKKACDSLGWKYEVRNDPAGKSSLHVFDLDENGILNGRGEAVLTLQGNKVSFNTYYLDNGAGIADTLRERVKALQVAYSAKTVQTEFEKVGFVYREQFRPEYLAAQQQQWEAEQAKWEALSQRLYAAMKRNRQALEAEKAEREAVKVVKNLTFSVHAKSTDPHETDPIAEISFEVLPDGTVVSDSNYIPRDLHDWADAAMEKIEYIFGHIRREGIEIKRKPVPERFRDKAYCTVHQKQGIGDLA